jgi:hypothetical protein
MSTRTPIARTCPECDCAEVVHVDQHPTHCPECRMRWCPFCWVLPAVVRWVPIGCQGTPFHVTTCGPCKVRLTKADALHPEASNAP